MFSFAAKALLVTLLLATVIKGLASYVAIYLYLT